MKPSSEGSGDVDDVGAKAAGVREDARQVPPVRQIEAQIFLHGKGECAAGQLEGAHRAILGGAIRGPCPHAEEGQAVAAGEGLEVPAGVGYAVDLVECVREVRDSGWNSGGAESEGPSEAAGMTGVYAVRRRSETAMRRLRRRRERSATAATRSRPAAGCHGTARCP